MEKMAREGEIMYDKQAGLRLMGMPPLWFFLCTAVVIISACLGKIPKNMLGGFAVCMVIGTTLAYVAGSISFIKNTIGGIAVVSITCATLKYFNIWPEPLVQTVEGFISGGSNFLEFYIGGLICGSILGMDRKLLINAGARYFVPLIAGVFVAYSFAGLIGGILGFGWKDAILYIAAPIMGGGTGGGAIPMSEIYNEVLGVGKDQVFAKIYPAVNIGNQITIIFAGLLNNLGKKKPELTGNGVIMEGFIFDEGTKVGDKFSFSIIDLGTGLLLSATFFIIGRLLNMFIPPIHSYALMIISVALTKISGILPERMEFAAVKWYDFLVANTTVALMAGVGITLMDMGELIAALRPDYFIICLFVVLGAIIGAGIVGRLVKFYFIESALTAGLCMSNCGGNGDVATLSAAERMELMPFAQISSRLGGAFVLVLQSILIRILS